MFKINEDMSIYVTRGDIVFIGLSANNNGEVYTFQPGEVLRIKVYGKKDAENVVLQKDFPVTAVTQTVELFLSEADTRIGEVISKPRDYWYEIELNSFDNPQTIIGYDEDGAKLFRLFPEGDDLPEYIPDPEVIKLIDTELDMTSERPVQNQVIARAFANLQAGYQATHDAVAALYVTPEMFGAIGDGVSDDYKALSNCFAYAEENGRNVQLKSVVYGVSQPLTVCLNNIIYGNNATLKAIATISTAVLTVNKPNSVLTEETYRGCSTVYDLNIDGNSLAKTGFFVRNGKGITLENIRVKAATQSQMQIGQDGLQVWELIVDNVELRSEHAGGYSPYGLKTDGELTDSYFKNILITNSSDCWFDCNGAACNFENIHGYGYPVELAAKAGFIFRGNGNFIKGISVDTPDEKGIIVYGDYNTFSEISVGNMQSETGIGIEVNGTANTFDGVRCSAYYCFYICSGEYTIDDFKCIRLFSRSEYDYFFTGKLPYRAILDTKTEVTNNIRRHFNFNNQWFYQSVLNMTIEFGAELRYNNYNVCIVGVEESAPNYSLVKSTTGCTITCTDAITSGKKVNVIIESPSITLV